MPPAKCLENIVILCIERRFSEQNSVSRLKSNILDPQRFCATDWSCLGVEPAELSETAENR